MSIPYGLICDPNISTAEVLRRLEEIRQRRRRHVLYIFGAAMLVAIAALQFG